MSEPAVVFIESPVGAMASEGLSAAKKTERRLELGPWSVMAQLGGADIGVEPDVPFRPAQVNLFLKTLNDRWDQHVPDPLIIGLGLNCCRANRWGKSSFSSNPKATFFIILLRFFSILYVFYSVVTYYLASRHLLYTRLTRL